MALTPRFFFILCDVFFPNKNKVYSSRSLPEPAHSTSFLKMAIICRSGRGRKVVYCVYAQEQSLFSMSHFFWQPVHIHSIESTADWIHFAFCNLVFIFLFFVVFAFSTIMNVCCQFHDETLFITTLHFVKAKIAVDLKRFLYFKINF